MTDLARNSYQGDAAIYCHLRPLTSQRMACADTAPVMEMMLAGYGLLTKSQTGTRFDND
jgi:hypothetical protein